MDFINDPATHSAGMLARAGRELLENEKTLWDQLCTEVANWLETSEVVLDLDGIRCALAAISLVNARAEVYLPSHLLKPILTLLAEVSATLVEIHQHPRPDMVWAESE